MNEETVKREVEFTSAMTISELGVSQIPKTHVLPLSQRPKPITQNPNFTSLIIPTIDLANLQNPSQRAQVIDEIATACNEIGIFQVINHGISLSVMKNALESATEFFSLSTEEKMVMSSGNIEEPVRYGTSFNQFKDKVFYWRDFIKLYSNPIFKWIHFWPSNPPTFREKMGKYAKSVHTLQKQLMEVIFESLGLNPNYLHEEVEEGSQVLAVNYYPKCPEPDLTLGIPPHSDFGSITILLQDRPGLQALDFNGNWFQVPHLDRALVVQLGDQTEVLTNGRYKSMVHRAVVSAETPRLSIASLHGLAGLERRIGPAPQIVGDREASYREFSFQDFLDYASCGDNDLSQKRFIDSLKKL